MAPARNLPSEPVSAASSSSSFPTVPRAYGRPSFRVAAQALELLAAPPAERARLEHTRDALATAVADAAPAWDEHVRTVAALDDVLKVSQNAQDLAASVSTLVDPSIESATAFGEENDAREMSNVLQNIEALEERLQLLAKVREFAVFADQAEKAGTDRSKQVVILGKALRLGTSSPLKQVKALSTLVGRLEVLASNLSKDLIFIICDGIFSLNADESVLEQSTRSNATDSRRSVSSAFGHLQIQKATSTKFARACTASKQLLDLRGPGSVENVIEEAADTGRVDELLRLAVERTLTMSTMDIAGAAAETVELESAGADGRQEGQSELGARGQKGRPLCSAIFNELLQCLRAVMDRLVRLNVDVPDPRFRGQPAVGKVWKIVEKQTVAFANVMLGLSTEVAVEQLRRDSSPSKPISSAINLVGNIERDKHRIGRSGLGWMEECVARLPGVFPNIYNLSVLYEPLLRIACLGTDNVPNIEAADCLIVRLLEDAGARLVDASAADVSSAAESVLRLRPATLLQVGSGQLSSNEVHRPRGLSDAASQGRLPLLPAIRDIAPIVADILSLASLVPGVAPRLGNMLAEQVLMPFATRCKAALDLVSSTAIAGAVYNRVVEDNPTMTARDVIQRISHREKRSLTLDAVVSLYRGRSSRETGGAMRRETYDSVAVLREHEWKAVIQLVASVYALTFEIRRCAGEDVAKAATDLVPLVRFRSNIRGPREPPSDASQSTGPLSSSSLASSVANRKVKFPTISAKTGTAQSQEGERLRNNHHHVGESSERRRLGDSQRAVSYAVNASRSSLGALESAVVDRAVVVLHADVVTRCYMGAYEALAGIGHSLQESKSRRENDNAGDPDSDGPDARSAVNMPNLLFASSTSGDSNTFQHLDYDEFGDLLADDEQDDFGDESLGQASKQADQSRANLSDIAKGHLDVNSLLNTSPSLVEVRSDVEMAASIAGRLLGEDLRWIEGWLRENIGVSRRVFIVAEADSAVAAGLAGGAASSVRNDVLIAAAARSFLHAARAQDTQILRDDVNGSSATKQVHLLLCKEAERQASQ